MGRHRARRMATPISRYTEEPWRNFVVFVFLPSRGCRSALPQSWRRNVSGTAAVVWVFVFIPDANGIHGEPEITGFPIFDREDTLVIWVRYLVLVVGGGRQSTTNAKHFRKLDDTCAPRYNIEPTQSVIVGGDDGKAVHEADVPGVPPTLNVYAPRALPPCHRADIS